MTTDKKRGHHISAPLPPQMIRHDDYPPPAYQPTAHYYYPPNHIQEPSKGKIKKIKT